MEAAPEDLSLKQDLFERVESFCENLLPHIQSSIDPPKALQQLASQDHDGIKSGKGFYDYALDFSKTGLDEAIQKRDQEFLSRLKRLYR